MLTIAEQLRTLIESARPRLLGITEKLASEKQFPDKWSVKETVGHLIDSAASNHQRIVRLQLSADIGRLTYAQVEWVQAQHYQTEPWTQIVQFWYLYNMHLSHVIAHVNPENLDHVCDMGYAEPAPLRFIIEDYVRHTQHHLDQILTGADPGSRKQWVTRRPTDPSDQKVSHEGP